MGSIPDIRLRALAPGHFGIYRDDILTLLAEIDRLHDLLVLRDDGASQTGARSNNLHGGRNPPVTS
jgi:hypothetical protein